MIQNVEALAEKYILLDSLLFKIVTTPERETTLLATPEKNVQIKLSHYIMQSICRTLRYYQNLPHNQW